MIKCCWNCDRAHRNPKGTEILGGAAKTVMDVATCSLDNDREYIADVFYYGDGIISDPHVDNGCESFEPVSRTSLRRKNERPRGRCGHRGTADAVPVMLRIRRVPTR